MVANKSGLQGAHRAHHSAGLGADHHRRPSPCRRGCSGWRPKPSVEITYHLEGSAIRLAGPFHGPAQRHLQAMIVDDGPLQRTLAFTPTRRMHMSKDGHIHACAGAMLIAGPCTAPCANGDVLVAGSIANGGLAATAWNASALTSAEDRPATSQQGGILATHSPLDDRSSCWWAARKQSRRPGRAVSTISARSRTALRNLQVARPTLRPVGWLSKVLAIGGNHLKGDTGRGARHRRAVQRRQRRVASAR